MSVDPDIIRNLESQVSALSRHLSQPGRALPEFEDIEPRISDLERTLAGNREFNPGGRTAGCRERGPLVFRFEIRIPPPSRRLPTICDRSTSWRGAPTNATPRRSKRSTTRFSRSSTGWARSKSAASRLSPNRSRRARKMALRDAPSIAPDDDMRIMADAATRAPAKRNARRRPGQALAGRSRGRGRRRRARQRRGGRAASPWPLDVRWSLARPFAKEAACRAGDDGAAVAARHGRTGANARPRAAARSQARQPSS